MNTLSRNGHHPTVPDLDDDDYEDSDVDTSLPTTAIIVPLMDRAQDLELSLPSLLSQDYPYYNVYVVDHGSRDSADRVLERFKNPKLHVIRVPRPDFYNRSKARNIGVRYSESDCVFFLDADLTFRDSKHLSSLVQSYIRSRNVTWNHWAKWRESVGRQPIEAKTKPQLQSKRRKVYSHTLGCPVIVERAAFQGVGGYNELMTDWGYEDSDLLVRLEQVGYGRIPMEGIRERELKSANSVAYHRAKDKEWTWQRNVWLSDRFITHFGVVPPAPQKPGQVEWVELDGVRYSDHDAPQQDWALPSARDSMPELPKWLSQYKRMRARQALLAKISSVFSFGLSGVKAVLKAPFRAVGLTKHGFIRLVRAIIPNRLRGFIAWLMIGDYLMPWQTSSTASNVGLEAEGQTAMRLLNEAASWYVSTGQELIKSTISKRYTKVKLMPFECPFCNTTIVENWQPLIAVTDAQGRPLARPTPTIIEYPEDIEHLASPTRIDSMTEWMRCTYPDCGQLLVRVRRSKSELLAGPSFTGEEETWLALPYQNGERQVHPSIPDDLAKDYREASATLEHSPRLSATLCIRVVGDVLARYAKLTQGSVFDRIGEFVRKDYYPRSLAANLDFLREMISRSPGSASDPNPIIEADRHEAEWALDVVDGLFDYFIAAPARDEERRRAYDERNASRPRIRRAKVS